MRRIVRASVLVFVLTATVHAGEMGMPIVQPPPPPSSATQVSNEPVANGEMGNGAAVSETGILLGLLETLLGLF